jgi:hypothetical protein
MNKEQNLQKNMLWDFETWYKNGERPNVTDLSEEKIKEMCSLFDYFTCSPNNRLHDNKTNKIYPICSRSRSFLTYEEALDFLKRYKAHYEKLILYSIQICEVMNEKSYKIRFAVFPER